MSKARDLAGIFNLNPTSGTTAQRPATADVGEIYYNGTTGKTQIYTPTGWQDMASGIPYGNTAGRPAAVTGQPYFNGETNRLELYTAGSGWQNIIQEVPGVASITGTYSEQAGTGTIIIAGTNFVTGAIASAIGTNGVEVQATSTTYNSLVQLTAVFTGLSNANEPYDIKVTNPSNLFGMIPDALYVNASPVWQTASGSLGTFNEQVSITLSALSATDSDSTTITYALASGSTLPSGVTLNSSTGVISGTLPDIATDTTYSFTVNATDGLNVIPRTFSITSKYLIPVEYLVVAGGGSGGRDQGGGGGAGGLRSGTLNVLPAFQSLITVGTGGVGVSAANRGASGSNSLALGLTAAGGGGGGGIGDYTNNDGLPGGSGGGGGAQWSFNIHGVGGAGNTPSVSPSQGNSGARGSSGGTSSGGGGGGGAGATGSQAQDLAIGNGGDGGVGIQSSITGTSTYYSGGGGGGVYGNGNSSVIPGNGGSGGGGKGLGPGSAAPANYTIHNGTANTGGGGGGGLGNGGVNGGSGGSGVVVIAYPNTFPAITTIPGTLTYDQPTRTGYRVYRFTAGSGTVTF
jgi:hypothetical protein